MRLNTKLVEFSSKELNTIAAESLAEPASTSEADPIAGTSVAGSVAPKDARKDDQPSKQLKLKPDWILIQDTIHIGTK